MTEKEKVELKKSLKEKAIDVLHKRIENASTAMHEAQLAANEEGKSSVGDKYETSRAMAQIDRDIHARQLESAEKDLTFIQHMDVTVFHTKVEVGTFVNTTEGKYFFLTGLGAVDVSNEKIFFLSISSPVGQSFSGKQINDVVIFNGKQITIKDLF
jgi:transcription elongation GreA/GreB family factor